jgi:transcription antitermination factor NusG
MVPSVPARISCFPAVLSVSLLACEVHETLVTSAFWPPTAKCRSNPAAEPTSKDINNQEQMGLAMAEPQANPVGPQATKNSKDMPERQPRRWIAAYTRSRHELAVASQFRQKGLDALLPTYRRLSRWSDRIRRTQTPLFPGYVFVRIADGEHRRVLQTGGVASIVCRSGKPVPLSDADVEKLRICMENPAAVEPHPYLRVGQRVRVKHGPFRGWEGVLVEKKNSTRLVLTIEQIMKPVSIDISGADVEALG